MSGYTSPRNTTNLRARLGRRCLQLASVLFIVGLGLALLGAWGERSANANGTWLDPADTIQPSGVAPDLALLSLAGVPDDQVLALSMAMGELETAHALLVFNADLTDVERTNGWLWLAFRYQTAARTQQASHAYHLSGTGAILGVGLPDLLRTETLLAVGRGLIPLHEKSSARFYLGQAALIAAYAPQLSAYERRSLLERLVPAMLQAGGRREDWSALDKAVGRGNDGLRNPAISRPVLSSRTDESAVGIAGHAAVAAVRDIRWAAAAARLQVLSVSPGEGPSGAEQAAQQALHQALLDEDAVVNGATARPGTTRESLIAAQETLLHWLPLKRAVAAGAAGGGLVPEWESSREEINAALTTAWTEWLALQTATTDDDGAGSFSEPPDHAVRQAIMAAYWGLYPDAPVAELLLAAHPASDFGGLRLTVLEAGTPPLLAWSE